MCGNEVRVAVHAALWVTGLASAGLMPGISKAQSTERSERTATEPASKPLEEVVVTGIRGSLRDALDVKLQSDLVVDAISTKDIGQLPDVTIAEALVRLPGMNGTRDRGNVSQATIRGLGPRMVLGMVNGRVVASPEPDRNIRYEQYPSELISGVQVYKSQSADLVAGGIAGTINLSTIEPLDYRGPSIVARGGPVYYEAAEDIPNYGSWGYRGSLSYIGTLSDTLGVAFGITNQKQKNGYPSLQGWGYNVDNAGDLNGDGTIDPTPWGAATEVKKIEQQRDGYMAAVQFRPSDSLQFKYDALYSKFDIGEDQNQTWFQNWGNFDGTGSTYTNYDVENGAVVAGTVTNTFVRNVIASYQQTNTVFVTGLNAEWSNDAWKVTADGSFSNATRKNIWDALYSDYTPASTVSWDYRAGITPVVTATQDTTDPAWQAIAGSQNDGPQRLHDDIYAIRLDASHDLTAGFFSGLDLGARYADRTKQMRASTWFQGATMGSLPSSLLSSYFVSGFTAPAVLDGSFNDVIIGVGGLDYTLATEDQLAGWRVGETATEGYVKGRFDREIGGYPLRGNLGVRFVQTDVESNGMESVNGAPLQPVSVSNSFTNVLPSLNLNLFLTERQILRVGLSRALAFAPLDELRAGRTLNTNAEIPTGSGGNPTLKPFEANQLDLSGEWYFAEESLAALALFYKDVDNYVGYRSEPADIDGTTYQIYRPANGNGGNIRGAEITFQTPLKFLPNFGIYANYAHVDSNIREFIPVADPLTANGLAKHTGTFDVWYSRGGFESRLGYKYHSEFTIIYGWNSQSLLTLEPESVLDWSASYQFTPKLGMRLQINNLTDEPLRLYYDNQPDRLARFDSYGRRALFDISVSF